MRIVRYPHPALRHAAKPVTTIDKDLRLRAGRMFELMYDAKGLGLAATQVALPCRLLVMNLQGDPDDAESERTFVNPSIVRRKGVIDDEEGCLSFPGFYVRVKRAREVTVEAFDLQGRPVRIDARGLEARLWQHEIDHLEGSLFIDKLSAVAKLSCATDLRALESEFRKARECGSIGPDADLPRLMDDLKRESEAG